MAALFSNRTAAMKRQVVRAWLDWQLLGSRAAGKMFQGQDCGLCQKPEWTISSKGF